jgi:hypothetical protein
MADAVEECMIDAVEMICSNQEAIRAMQPGGGGGRAATKASPDNCPALQGPRRLKFMVVIPETHIARRIPDPAGETEIIRRFTEFGFDVVDPQIVGRIREHDRINLALTDNGKAAALGAEFGADVVIIGEAVSEGVGAARGAAGMLSCRARVEARMVRTSTGKILATHGVHGSGLDNSEAVAAKTALRNAGGQLADYFLLKLCEQADLPGGGAAAVSSSEFVFNPITYSQLNQVYTYLKTAPGVRNVARKLDGPTGRLTVEHSGAFDTLVDALVAGKAGVKIDITEFGDNRVVGRIK